MQETDIITKFAIDTLKGLSSLPKYLLSKYFYDEYGSRIFQNIMQMPEYYLTDCEAEIFDRQKKEICTLFNPTATYFDLIELGAGDGLKTKILLQHLIDQTAQFSFMPIDISKEAVKSLVSDLNSKIPSLKVDARTGDYFQMMEEINRSDSNPKIILFLGSNIGNYNESESLDFLTRLNEVMNPGDQLFIGFDLKKDPEIILNAYNDPHGFTASFNLNLLQRINDELGGNFELLNFKHHEIYDPLTGTAKSYLISKRRQTVQIQELNIEIEFKKWEPIYMEMSQKYDEDLVLSLATRTGFKVVRNFYDERQYFMNSLWKLNN